MASNRITQVATFGGGCFWCVEAVFLQVPGVQSAVSGYAGGSVPDPRYEQVCSGSTGHAEVVRIGFDPEEVSYAALLELFFAAHDPTTLNRQGDDIGTQYRSVIFYHSPEQKAEAERKIKALNESNAFGAPLVTELVAAPVFYAAEGYHQDYYRRNPGASFCQMVIGPKVEKIGKRLKPSSSK